MTQTTMIRTYALGLGYGSIWLVSACLAIGILDIFGIMTTLQGTIFSVRLCCKDCRAGYPARVSHYRPFYVSRFLLVFFVGQH